MTPRKRLAPVPSRELAEDFRFTSGAWTSESTAWQAFNGRAGQLSINDHKRSDRSFTYTAAKTEGNLVMSDKYDLVNWRRPLAVSGFANTVLPSSWV